jgi:mono/diheme cytochrome c family protein
LVEQNTLSRHSLLLGFLPFLLLVQCGPGKGPAESSSPSSPQPSIASIKRAYTIKCSLCHGNDGKLMASKAPDLSVSKMSLEERIALITYGKGTMPPQKDILDAATIRGVAAYIEEFRD